MLADCIRFSHLRLTDNGFSTLVALFRVELAFRLLHFALTWYSLCLVGATGRLLNQEYISCCTIMQDIYTLHLSIDIVLFDSVRTTYPHAYRSRCALHAMPCHAMPCRCASRVLLCWLVSVSAC